MSDPLISDRTRNQDALAEESSEPVLLVNLFTPKEGHEDDFMRAQVGEYERLNGQVPGWIGNRLGRAVDGSGFVNIALFESLKLYQNW
ncbi:antibiotic biosynthesis monooxygenase family protein [Vacuolonema iberomarrocanum]|uniref:antibiotic biosynthesis monooxygenase family protein n=1 Tax=Vacuolonema iberomarrocanum TaxID=3454632 RepID=UPI0019F2C58E|nr:antibiotic biosynthesis monooxygenase [filamentous cyanobacterium LEGE 07170]